jgi:transcriptional regulator with XRE-family HTH domain
MPASSDGFAGTFRDAVAASGLSLESLRRRLELRGVPVSIATLSYWQTGRSKPQRAASLEALALLEQILQVPRGHLSSRLGSPRRPGRPRRTASPAATVTRTPLPEQAPLLRQSLLRLGFGPHQELLDLSTHVTVDLDDTGMVTDYTVRSVVRSARDGAQRIPVYIALERRTEHPPRLRPVGGSRIGRHLALPEAAVYVWELLLDQPVAMGATAAAEYVITLPDGLDPEEESEYFLPRELSEMLMWVRFHPAKVPAQLVAYARFDGDETTTTVDLAGRTSHQHVVHRAGPGTVGMRWAW